MTNPIEPVNLSHCVMSPLFPAGYSSVRSFSHPVRAYSVTAKQTGKEWLINRVKAGDFSKWAIQGQGTAYSSPQEAALAINSLLRG